jgi:hypothetical protein
MTSEAFSLDRSVVAHTVQRHLGQSNAATNRREPGEHLKARQPSTICSGGFSKQLSYAPHYVLSGDNNGPNTKKTPQQTAKPDSLLID